MTKSLRLLALVALATPALSVSAQEASFIYRLGKDTMNVEQFTRTANRIVGEVVTRNGAVVTRTQYDATLGVDGRATAATYKILGADGKPIKGRPVEIKYVVNGDSAVRTINWGDSTATRTLGAKGAFAFAAPSYGMLEPAFVALRKGAATSPIPFMNAGAGPTLQTSAFVVAGGDSIRLPSGLVFIVDKNGILQTVDGSGTTGKLVATRGKGGLNLAAIAATMKPTGGVLSGRGTSRGHFVTNAPGGVIMVDYGRPLVRDRTVWGGLLIPLDTIWRLGANEATHFATSREITFGDVVVPPGLYTLFLYNAKSGPMLAINKQVGQWGTVYDQAKDLARVPLTMGAAAEYTEEFTINIKQGAPSRGSIEIVWGAQSATANFVVK
ncbi:MAG: DUF2911 domain-containing protein [Gemmatimonadota bacterium]